MFHTKIQIKLIRIIFKLITSSSTTSQPVCRSVIQSNSQSVSQFHSQQTALDLNVSLGMFVFHLSFSVCVCLYISN